MIWLTAVALAAAATEVCRGPAGLEKAIAAKPSPAAYNALGAHFARAQNFDCAIRNFEAAFKLDAKLPARTGEHGLCLIYTAPIDGALYALEKVSLGAAER